MSPLGKLRQGKHGWSRAPAAVGPEGWGCPGTGVGSTAWPQAVDSCVFAETAMNIGYACKLLTDDMEVLEERKIR